MVDATVLRISCAAREDGVSSTFSQLPVGFQLPILFHKVSMLRFHLQMEGLQVLGLQPKGPAVLLANPWVC